MTAYVNVRRAAACSWTNLRSAGLAAVLAAALTAPCMASPKVEIGRSRSITVTFSDLNLESDAGARVLLRRIRNAASKICGGAPPAFELWKLQPYRDCVNDATRRAVMDLNRPLITSLYEREQISDSRTLPPLPVE